MVVVEALVSEEKLRQLLDEQAESAALDFKSECDLSQKPALVELAKDVGALQMRGGFIVFGADDRGRPTGGLTKGTVPLFDEARLRSKLRKWIPDPLELLSARHEVDGTSLVLMYVGASPLGFAVFQADGKYLLNGKEVTVFRKGDVFARHGSASEPWNQSDLPYMLDRAVEARKEEWRRTLVADLARIQEAAEGGRIARGLASALTWNLDAATFETAVIEQMRASDNIPLLLLLERLPSEAARLAQNEELRADLPVLFDRLACAAAVGLRLDRPDVVERVIEGAGDVYDVGFALMRGPTPRALDASAFWLELIERIIALGALAVRRRAWVAVRLIALRRGDNHDWRYWRSWLRHGMTTAARSKLLVEEQDGRQTEKSLLSLAHHVAVQRDYLRGGTEPEDEALLDSICQFDALAALAIIADTRTVSTSHFYPNFSHFYSHRTEPIIVRLLSDEALRKAIFPLPDAELATALRGLNVIALKESFRYAGWDGYTDDRIRRFLESHPADEESSPETG